MQARPRLFQPARGIFSQAASGDLLVKRETAA
jgi:hypothetical protein